MMSEDDTDEASQSLVTGEPNERLVIEWAIGALQGRVTLKRPTTS
jgi:hypothetical protein